MRKLLFCVFISQIFFQCTSDKIPSDVLSVNQLKGIVWDLMKAGEVALNDTIHHKEIDLAAEETMLFQKVFALHHIDKNTFYKSYDFYIQHPEWNSILMDSVNAVASRERNELFVHPYRNTKIDSTLINRFKHPKKTDSTFLRRINKLSKIDTNFYKHARPPL